MLPSGPLATTPSRVPQEAVQRHHTGRRPTETDTRLKIDEVGSSELPPFERPGDEIEHLTVLVPRERRPAPGLPAKWRL